MKDKRISIKQLTLARFKVTQLYEEANETEKKELLKAVNYALCFPSSTTPKRIKYFLRKDRNIDKFYFVMEEYLTPIIIIFGICYFTLHFILF
jgi:hypothetical protein